MYRGFRILKKGKFLKWFAIEHLMKHSTFFSKECQPKVWIYTKINTCIICHRGLKYRILNICISEQNHLIEHIFLLHYFKIFNHHALKVCAFYFRNVYNSQRNLAHPKKHLSRHVNTHLSGLKWESDETKHRN